MRPEKQLIQQEYTDRIRERSGVILADYRGLSAESFVTLRREVSTMAADCLVVKNRIFKYILKENGLEPLDPFFEGQTAVITTDNELPELLKVIIKYEENEGSPQLKAAVWDGEFYKAEDLQQLSKLPSRDELLSRVISGMQAPLSGLVGVMNGVISSLPRVIKAIQEKKAN